MDEDFGISPVESMAAGKPVIGVDEGGVKESVLAGETGLLCPAQPKVSDIVAAVTQMSPEYALSMKHQCQQRAQLFSAEIFIDKMTQLLSCDNDELWQVAKTVDSSEWVGQMVAHAIDQEVAGSKGQISYFDLLAMLAHFLVLAYR